jgi:hypothetical protein
MDLVAASDVAVNRVEIAVMGWAQVGHTATHMAFLGRKIAGSAWRRVRPSAPRPWLRQKKGRAAN